MTTEARRIGALIPPVNVTGEPELSRWAPAGVIIERLETELGKPGVTSNQSPLWLGVRALGVTAPVPGAGRLLAGPFAPGVGALAPPGEHRA
jgi:maleate cis-trans isomerase